MDYLIKNPLIVDGSGKKAYKANVYVQGDSIKAIGQSINAAAKIIDAEGMLLIPGFIDMHCHPEGALFHVDKNFGRALQGITTEIAGNCGTSPAPCGNNMDLLKAYCAATYAGFSLPWRWKTFNEYLKCAKDNNPVINYGSLVGHGSIRIAAMGMENRPPNKSEMQIMKSLLSSSIDEGAMGFSLGLIYPPGVFAQTDELIELASVVADKNKILCVHMRNESNKVVQSLKEMISIAEKTGVKMHISHHKIAGLKNKTLSDTTLALFEESIARGIDIGFDMYPYTAGCTQLSAILPPWVHEGGVNKLLERISNKQTRKTIENQILTADDSFDNLASSTTWDNIIISDSGNKEHIGKSIAALSKERGQDELDYALSLILEQKNNVMMILYTMNDYDVENILSHPIALYASDGVPSLGGSNHPRYLGTFIKILAQYQKEKKLLSLEDAISRMTGKVAKRCEIQDRGLIEVNKKADMVLIDYDNLKDVTTYENPNKTNPGIKYVFINGVLAVNNSKATGTCSGRIITV